VGRMEVSSLVDRRSHDSRMDPAAAFPFRRSHGSLSQLRASTRADRAATAERATSAFAIERPCRRPGPDGPYWCGAVTISALSRLATTTAVGQIQQPSQRSNTVDRSLSRLAATNCSLRRPTLSFDRRSTSVSSLRCLAVGFSRRGSGTDHSFVTARIGSRRRSMLRLSVATRRCSTAG
jgi:hypothetical protein